MNVFKLTISEGWSTIDTALFAINEKSEAKITAWAISRIKDSRKRLPESEQQIDNIIRDISKFKLTSGEILKTDDDICLFVEIAPVL